MRQAPAVRPVSLRQMNVVVGGWFLVAVLCLSGIWLATEGLGQHHRPIAGLYAAAAATWAALVRPKVSLTPQGALLCNLVRQVHIPWSQIDGCTARWSLRVVTEDGRGFSAWAIGAERAGGDPVLSSAFQPGHRVHHVDPATLESTVSPRSAAAVGGLIQEAVEEYEQAVADGRLPAASADVRVTPAWPGILAVALTIVLIAIAVLT